VGALALALGGCGWGGGGWMAFSLDGRVCGICDRGTARYVLDFQP